MIIYLKRGAFQRYGSEAVRCLQQPWNTSPRKHQFAKSTPYKSGRLLSDAVMICAVSDPLPVFYNGEYHQHAAPAQEAFCHLPRRQPSGGFGEICHVHPERAHICRCINFTTIPRRIQDKCITFILLFYFLQRNPCNCGMPHYEHFWHICWCYAGYTHLRRSTQHAYVRAESVEKNFSTHPTVFLGILSFFVESLHDF